MAHTRSTHTHTLTHSMTRRSAIDKETFWLVNFIDSKFNLATGGTFHEAEWKWKRIFIDYRSAGDCISNDSIQSLPAMEGPLSSRFNGNLSCWRRSEENWNDISIFLQCPRISEGKMLHSLADLVKKSLAAGWKKKNGRLISILVGELWGFQKGTQTKRLD